MFKFFKTVGNWIRSIHGWWLAVSAIGSILGGAVAVWEQASFTIILALAVNLFAVILLAIWAGVEIAERSRLRNEKSQQQQFILARLNRWGQNKISLADATALWSLTANPYEYEWKAKFKSLKKACRDGILPIAVLAGKKPNAKTAVTAASLRVFLKGRCAIPKDI